MGADADEFKLSRLRDKEETTANAGPDYTPSGPLLNLIKAAEYLSISGSILRKLTLKGLGPRRTRLPTRKQKVGDDPEGRLLLFAKADLDAWINAHRCPV